jgi:hypothetical protein
MFNFRENMSKQITSRKAAAILMRIDLTACITWIYVHGIIVCRFNKAVP